MSRLVDVSDGGVTGIVLSLTLIILAFGVDSGEGFGTDKYDGYKVIRLHPTNPQDTDTLWRMLPSNKGSHTQLWPVRRRRSTSMDITVSPAEMSDLLELIEYLQIPHETLVDDLRVALDDHENEVTGHGEGSFDILRYNTLDKIQTWLHTQADKLPHMMDVMTIGQSWEGRPIEVVRIQSPSQSSHQNPKPAIWMDAGIHANEWVGPATLLYYINEFLTRYNADDSITDLLDTFDVYLLPVFNVDGYAYTWNEDRLWRKSRSKRNSTSCTGVDMNRNWPYKWGYQPGVSTDPCSVIYGGPSAASEPEIQAVVQWLQDHRSVIKAYVAFHSYSQLVMMPYSYSNRKPRDYEELANISRQMAQSIQSTHGKEYNHGTVTELLGEASGSSVDYTYRRLGVKYSFGIELRDEGLFGSLLPPSQIEPTAQESLEGIKTLASLIKDSVQ